MNKHRNGLLRSSLFTKPSRSVDGDEVSLNAQLLGRAGYVHKLMAGVYSFLPLGIRVLTKIERIIREEMDALGANEILMPALQPKEPWAKTGRWDTVDVLFRLKGAGDRDLALGPTHEEVVTPLVGQYINSYRDLPIATYQIQTKFRNEVRAKSGLLRGREFRMKDMYSFHTSQNDLDSFYVRVIDSYRRIFERCGVGEKTILAAASGGVFSKFSHEFQTITENGEDIIYLHPEQEIAVNKELLDSPEFLKDLGLLDQNGAILPMEERKAIEVGNIFKLGTRFSDAFDLSFTNENGHRSPILMGCYGLGPSRLMGAIVECTSDQAGLIWPKEVAPFNVYLISLSRSPSEREQADKVYSMLCESGIEVLYDDREEIRAGEKFTESDLMGIPIRMVVSDKTLKQNSVELKHRSSEHTQLVEIANVVSLLRAS